jgi:hypothetical protein
MEDTEKTFLSFDRGYRKPRFDTSKVFFRVFRG